MRIAAGQVILTAAIYCGAAISGCGGIMAGVLNPMTPDESRRQVLDAARQVVSTLGLDVVDAWFWHAACNSRGEPPFRGQMRIGYPLATSSRAAGEQIATMVGLLRRAGWSADPNFHSHSPALRKNNVIVVLRPQDPGASTRGLEVIGECRDVTTTIDERGRVQPVMVN
jgi:hypothetical protein